MKRDPDALFHDSFDLLVVGGGIYGAWTAYDAALRGLRVALVDQGDWAGATSSGSSKLIHGGLRYLESGDIGLVRKALHERQRLLRLGPHRVWPLRFGIPVTGDSRLGAWRLRAGLWLYDWLAGARAEQAHRHFDANAFALHFPFLDRQQLRQGFSYADAQTDDARLVLELVDGALAAGAVAVNYCHAAATARGEFHTIRIEDRISGHIGQLQAREIVFATGQWGRETVPGREDRRLTKGVHLVLPRLSPTQEALLLTAPQDGRVFFILPWYGRTILGTTDTDYRGDVEHVAADDADVAYLLAAANHYLKTSWQPADIIGRFAALRAMKRSEQANPSAVSRDWELHAAPDGTLHSIGGKITSAREDAAHIVDTVCRRLGRPLPCATTERPLPWALDGNDAALRARSQSLGIDEETTLWLLRRHGNRTAAVLDRVQADAALGNRIVPDLPLIMADLHHCAATEMVERPDDLLRRRLPLAILTNTTQAERSGWLACAAPHLAAFVAAEP
ncbi:MAG: glycerol-3-phosphate dehydrogenase/oxidase [Proteobacteria bacterium]|nr:glycerol-3-phosphate dehydrogenase/oxidase [Pseudomonadota bacterium]HQR02949.1 glycerol-3-phosphate dehydrogenase/oxidase [Rhodocyclaceae bacterium]